MVEEWQSWRPVVDDQVDAEQFALKTADVVDWNGKLVILTEGKWNMLGIRSHNLFIDADGDGRYIEEVVYQAPISQYREHLNEAMLAMQSIEWKSVKRW